MDMLIYIFFNKGDTNMYKKKLTISVANMPQKKEQEEMIKNLSEYLKISYERGVINERNN